MPWRDGATASEVRPMPGSASTFSQGASVSAATLRQTAPGARVPQLASRESCSGSSVRSTRSRQPPFARGASTRRQRSPPLSVRKTPLRVAA